jgi:tetratricopeptide (TPR) repeat protein/transcriptional regulator with XRE-family HTH domain
MGQKSTEGVTRGIPASSQPLSFASLLHGYRVAANLTQEELAERSGVSVRAISDLERGAKLRPQRATVEMLADGLELDDADRSALEASVPTRTRPVSHYNVTTDLPTGGFLGAMPDDPMVAREAETEQIRAAIDAVKDGEGRLLLLLGEPGVGKTRLSQEATIIARDRGMFLAAGQCFEPRRVVAFYPFLQAVGNLVLAVRGRLGIDPIHRWPQLQALMLDTYPSLAVVDHVASGEGDQLRLFWAVATLIETLAESMPVALALDDLHWADQSSLDLLHYLARQLRSKPVLLLGTYRDHEVVRGHPLRQVLRDLHRNHLVDEIAVRQLTADGTSALVASTLGSGRVAPDLAALVHRHTEGNAFFVQEMVRTLVERGDASLHDGEWSYSAPAEIAIPRSVQDAVEERLSRLSERAQTTLREASVLGETFEFDDLQAMSERPEVDIEEDLAEAERASVVRPVDRDRFAFNHALTQQVMYRDLTSRRRRHLHLSAGNAIVQQPTRVREQRATELAWHFKQGGNWGKAIRYATLAGDQAEDRYAHREAEGHYSEALELAGELEDVAAEALILERMGRVLTNVGRYDDAKAALDRSTTLYRGIADVEGEVRVTVQLGSVHRATGTSDAGIGQVRALLGRLEPDGRPQDIAELSIVLDTLLYATGRYREALAAVERASELTRSMGDISALARAETGRGTELLMLGRLDEGLSVLEGAIALPHAEEDPFNLVRALDNAAAGYRTRGNFQRSLELARRSLTLGERIQSPWDTAIALSGLGATYRMLGEWAEARRHLERGVALTRTVPAPWWATYVMFELGRLYLDEGKWQDASRLVQDALDISYRSGHLEGIRAGESVMAELDLIEGRPKAARDRLEPILDRRGLEEHQVTDLLPILTAAYEASGNLETAGATIGEAIRRATSSNSSLPLATSLVVSGKLSATRGRLSNAEQEFQQAAELAHEMSHPYLEALALFEWGVILADRRDDQRARELLEPALAFFQRLGARPYIERTEASLATLGD